MLETKTTKTTRSGEVNSAIVTIVFETEGSNPPGKIQVNMSGEKDTFYASAHYDVKNKNLSFQVNNQHIDFNRVREITEIAISQIESIINEFSKEPEDESNIQ